MQAENSVFFFNEADKQLFCRDHGGSYGKLTPLMIDKEMQYTKNRSELHVHRLTQAGLEHFVDQYGSTYEVLYLDDCTCLTDLAPLADMPNLTAVRIERCRNISDLWPLSANKRLRILSICDSKKLTYYPSKLNTSNTLEEVRFWGGIGEHKYHMQSLSFLEGMASLRRLDLNSIALDDHATTVLLTLPNMEEFHFDASMLTTEEIAMMCVRYPHIHGQSLGPYTADDAGADGNVRICGTRKPTLMLPADNDKLLMYVENFNNIMKKLLEK